MTLDRPQRRNAVDSTTLVALRHAMASADADPEIRAMVLTGAGDNAFCAGIDMKEPEPPAHDGAGLRQWRGRLAEVFLAAEDLGTPLVCRVNGPALGAGFGLAAMGDVIVAAEGAWFALPEIDVGRWPLAVGAVLLGRLPRQVVLELAMTGRRMDATEARELGLVRRVSPSPDLDRVVDEVVAVLASKPPTAMARGLQTTRHMVGMSLSEASELALDVLDDLLDTEAARQGSTRFQARHPGREQEK
jgi:enoyl-CoA hydratase/carnithine racemase